MTNQTICNECNNELPDGRPVFSPLPGSNYCENCPSFRRGGLVKHGEDRYSEVSKLGNFPSLEEIKRCKELFEKHESELLDSERRGMERAAEICTTLFENLNDSKYSEYWFQKSVTASTCAGLIRTEMEKLK